VKYFSKWTEQTVTFNFITTSGTIHFHLEHKRCHNIPHTPHIREHAIHDILFFTTHPWHHGFAICHKFATVMHTRVTGSPVPCTHTHILFIQYKIVHEVQKHTIHHFRSFLR